MKYVVKMMIKGYSYVGPVCFNFDDKFEALDFAEMAQFRAKPDTLASVSMDIIREEAEA